MADVLLDTDIFVDHLRGVREIQPGRNLVRYSVITRCELFAGHATDEERVGQLLAPFGELEVNRAIGERAGRLRRTLRDQDAGRVDRGHGNGAQPHARDAQRA